MSNDSSAEIIRKELVSVREEVPTSEIRAAVSSLVQLQIQRGQHVSLLLQIQFPSSYPNNPLSVQLKSKSLPILVIKRLETFADQKAAEFAKNGKPSVLAVHEALSRYIHRNLLLLAFDEVKELKSRYSSTEGYTVTVTPHESLGEVDISVTCESYHTTAKFSLPENYPYDECRFKILSTNVPSAFQAIFEGTTRETGRKLVRPKLDEPPQKAHTLLPMARFFIEQLAGRYPKEECQMCHRRMLPTEAGAVSIPASARVVRIYCSHLFHAGCLKKYLETPPFGEGKLCPDPTCGKRIYHQKFKTAGDVRLAERRWAHKQARQRELKEVTEFLRIDDENVKEQEDEDDFGAFY